MAYPLDVAGQNDGLKAWFGDGRAVSVPASWEIALFTGHPLGGGTELTSAGGYARLVVANSTVNFPDPVDGVVTSAQFTWPAPTAAYSDVATHYLLLNAADSTTRWYVGQLATAINVTAAQPGFATQLAIRWNTEGA